MNVFHPAMFSGSTFWQPAGEAMLEFLVSGSAVALVFMLIRRVISRLPATIRYLTASTAMAALVGVAVYHAWEHWPVSPSPGAAVASGASPSTPTESRAVSSPAVSAAASAPADAASQAGGGRFTWDAVKPRLILALPVLWLIGAPLTALFVGLGWTGAARLRRHSTPLIDETLLARFARCQALIQVKDVGLAVCERIAAPIVVGIFRPLILLPPALLTSLSCEQWEMILLHELAHVRRLDNLVNLLQRAVETVLFFHPAVWWASRWMRLEREHCCDAVVLRLGTSPQSYAETLAVLALPGIAPQLATAAMANHELLTRMRHILGTEDLPMTISWKKLGLAAVMFAVVGGLVASDWSSSAHRAAAAENRQKQLEETILRRVLIDLGANGTEALDFVRTRQHDGRTEMLQAVIDQIERLKAESSQESSSMGGPDDGVAFANRLIGRLQRLQAGEAAVNFYGSDAIALAYSDHSTKSYWAPRQMLGPPDVKAYGDDLKAWAAREPDQGHEWVRLGYQRPIKAAAILIYESFNPGAVTSVRIMGGGTPGEEIVWEATGEPKLSQTKNVLTIPIKDPSKILISAVNLHLDETRTPGWSEIDAVGLVDAETGETHWAKTAEASSTYASIYQEAQLGPQWSIDNQMAAGWSPGKAIGPPDASSGHDPKAWAAREADKGEEWLQLGFGGEYRAAAVVIHENYNPGAIRRVEFLDDAGERTIAKPTSKASSAEKQVTVVRSPASGKVRTIRIVIDEPKVPGWNEIDAVGLIDAESGETRWATHATASSSYADVGSPEAGFTFTNITVTPNEAVPSWHPRQATGAPNVPTAGDDGRAWASLSQDGQKESLVLTFNPPVESNLLLVYESFNPGALIEVQVDDVQLHGYTDGVSYTVTGRKESWRSVWTGRDPVQPVNGKGVAAIPLANVGKLSKVRLVLDSVAVSGWNEIDAVGLLNSETGQVQWASDAKASSWFGEQGAMFGTISEGGYGEVYVPTRTAPQFFDVPIGTPATIGGEWEVNRNVDIDAAGVIRMGDQTLTHDELAASLRLRLEKNAQTTVRIRAHRDCSFQEVKKLFDTCKEAGVVKLSLTRAEAGAGEEQAASVDLDKLAVVAFGNDIVVNLNELRPHYLRFKLQLLVDKEGKKALENELERYRVVLKDRLLQHCGEKSTADLRGSAGLQLLKDGIFSTIRDVLPASQRASLKDVLLEELMIQ